MGRLATSSFKRYCLVPMQKTLIYCFQLRSRMSKLKTFLSASDIRERSLSWLVWDHCMVPCVEGEGWVRR